MSASSDGPSPAAHGVVGVGGGSDNEIEGRDLEKSFDRVRALQGVSLAIGRGEARGLVGENGAGKSTLINVLTGAFQADRGTVLVRGTPTTLKTPRVALDLGIATVHQQNRLVPSLTVTENLELGNEDTRTPLGWLRGGMRDEAGEALEFVGMTRYASAMVGSLSLANRQLVSIARALSRGGRMLIFDEPTAALSPVEAHYLFDVVARLRERGTTLLYVTHRLEELPHVVDRITVMRDGRVVAMRESDVAGRELVELMAGSGTASHEEALVSERRQVTAHRRHDESPLMTVMALDDGEKHTFADVSFEVLRGEILGIVGLPDSGALEVAQGIAGARRTGDGTISLDGSRMRYRTPRGALAIGIGYLAGDRSTKGVLPNFSVRDTITLSALPRTSRRGLLRLGAEAALSDRLVAECRVRAGSTDLPITALSGGNQQKALFARLLAAEPRLIVCEDATAGVDVAGRESIYELITQWCELGNAAIWNTSDLRELVAICDRVLVLRKGRIVNVVPRAELSINRLMAAQFGQPVTDDPAGEPAGGVSDHSVEAPDQRPASSANQRRGVQQ
jgi:ABC-type sugar transport system ATPase subunit